MDSLEKAVVESLNQAFPTIVTSGSILTCAGFLIGGITSNGVIASLGKTLGRGTLISIIMVMLFLPQLLMVFDKLIDKTALTRGERRRRMKRRHWKWRNGSGLWRRPLCWLSPGRCRRR